MKANKWINGRKNIFEQIGKLCKEKIDRDKKLVWFHCASLGEFEQGRPVIEALKEKDKKQQVFLTFFSPSGYEVRKDYAFADAVCYLPPDFPSNAKKFIAIVRPDTAIFVKYEFWINYLNELKRQKIPTFLISTVFSPGQRFFKWYGKIFFNILSVYKKIFLQDQASYDLLREKGFTNIEIAGDTRFDRVMQVAKNKKSFPEVENFCGQSLVIIAGSSRPKDEELLLRSFNTIKKSGMPLKLILVPHEVDEASLASTENRIRQTRLSYCVFSKGISKNSDVLIVNTVGHLSQLYQYGTLAYIGGGFNDGIHNILEPLVYHIPVTYGPNYLRFIEAVETHALGITRSIASETELTDHFKSLLENTDRRNILAEEIRAYMNKKTGATAKICVAF